MAISTSVLLTTDNFKIKNGKDSKNASIAELLQAAQDEGIVSLDLSNGNFKTLDFSAGHYPSIEVLDISYNKKAISKVVIKKGVFPNLRYLYLYKSQIAAIEIAADALPNLEVLHLAENKLTTFALPAGLEAMETLYLYKNSIENLPKEAYDKERENCLSYFKALEAGEVINTTAKVVLFGNGTAGKTTLSHHLRTGEFKKDIDSTHGILSDTWGIKWEELSPVLQTKLKNTLTEIQKKDPKTTATLPTQINLVLWDFGGQEYYHATHRIFLNHNILYLLVWETGTNNNEEMEMEILKNGKPETVMQANFPKKYWEDTIQFYLDKDSENYLQKEDKKAAKKILYIQNKVKKGVKKETDGESAFAVNCYYEKEAAFELNMGEIRDQIIQELENMDYIGLKIPAIYEEIRVALAKCETIDIDFETYKKFVCDKDSTPQKILQKEEQIKALTQYLHETGAILCYHYKTDNRKERVATEKGGEMRDIFNENKPNSLKNYVFVQPKKVTDIIYKVLSEEVKKKNGTFDIAHVETVLKEFKNLDKLTAPDLIAIMKEFELIFEVEKKGKKCFIASQYLNKECPNEEALEAYCTEDLPHTFTLRFPEFLPRSVMVRFLANYGKFHQKHLYWRDNLVFKATNKSVYIQFDYSPQEHKDIILSIQDNDRQIAHEIFSYFEEDIQNNTEISVNGKDFVPIKELEKHKNIGTILCGTKEIAIQAFDFMFEPNCIKEELTDREKKKNEALKLVNQSEIAAAFAILDTIITDNVDYSRLKKEIITEGMDKDFIDRLKIFIRNIQ